MSVRNPLGRAEAQVAQLTYDLADLRRELDRAVSRLKTATSTIWRLKRRNAVLLAAQQKRSGVVSQISSDAMWSREVSVLLEFCARWAAQDDLPELCCRMLNRLKTTDVRAEPLLLTLTDKQGPVFDKLRKAMNRERDWEIAGHISQVWSPGLMDTLRLCIGLSYNRTMWLESAFKYDWDVNELGHKVKKRHMLAPDSEIPLPSPFVVARMREVGPELLSGEAENLQSADRKAAWVKDVDHAFLRVVETTPRTGTGGWTTQGTKESKHVLLLTYDGAKVSADTSGVTFACLPANVERLNQSCQQVNVKQKIKILIKCVSGAPMDSETHERHLKYFLGPSLEFSTTQVDQQRAYAGVLAREAGRRRALADPQGSIIGDLEGPVPSICH